MSLFCSALPRTLDLCSFASTNKNLRFVDTEKWRKETDLDNTIATWDYPEKADIQQYYQQFYHKTDNVGLCLAPT